MAGSTEYHPCFELKEVKEDGSFVGIASIYGVEDLGGDVIDKGAFRKTIAENPSVPVLWQHKSDEVIGMGTIKEWQGKVLLEAQLDLEDPTAQKAHKKLKNGLIRGLSIGFETIKFTWEDIEGRMVRHIGELKLWEVSIVTFPMLTAAHVTRVKSAEQERIEELESQVLALSKVTSGSGADDGKTAAAKTQTPVIDHSAAAAKADQILSMFKEV